MEIDISIDETSDKQLKVLMSQLTMDNVKDIIEECIKYTYNGMMGNHTATKSDMILDYRKLVVDCRKQLIEIGRKLLKCKDIDEIKEYRMRHKVIQELIKSVESTAKLDADLNNVMLSTVDKAYYNLNLKKVEEMSRGNDIKQNALDHKVIMEFNDKIDLLEE